MSGFSRALFGEKTKPAQYINTTPGAFQGLQGPLAQQLQQLMANPAQYQGQYAAPISGAEQAALGGVQNASQQVGGQNLGVPGLAYQSAGAMNPFAGLTGLERFGLGQVTQQAFGQNPQQGQANAFLGQQLNGVMNPYAGAAGLGAGEQQGLNAIQQTAFGPNALQNSTNQQLQQLIGGQQNPYADQLMQAAVRPILDNFSDQALQQRGLFTGAGQQIQGRGSSPFAQASARLAGNVANAVGDTTAQLGAQLFNQQQQSQLAALNMAQQQPGLTLSNQLAATQALGLPREIAQLGLNNQASAFGQMQQNQFNAAGLTDQFSGNALQRALAGLDAAGTGQVRQGAAFENAANRQVDASGQLGQLNLAQQQAQLQAQLQNLQAQGLPRMVQQLGIEGGLNQFNNQQQQLLQLLQLSGQLSGPTGAVLPGQQGSGGAFQAFAGGFGQGLGTFLGSDRRLKKDVQFAGKTPNGTKVYRFNYLTDDSIEPMRLGVMADEVTHIPGAVVRNAAGIAFVDYNRVMAHG